MNFFLPSDGDIDLIQSLAPQSNEQRLFDLNVEEQLQNREARRKYGHGIFIAALGWQVFVGAVLGCQTLTPASYRLSDPVMVALLGSSPVSIFGALIVLAKYYFPFREPVMK